MDPRFAPMIDRLERSASKDGRGYRRNVVIAGLVGYGVLAGTLLLFAGLTLLMIVMMFTVRTGMGAGAKGTMIFGAISLALLRALWIERATPDGMAIARDEAPELFALVDRIRQATGGPAVHDIRLTDQLNAAITQEARFLAFGGTNTLYIGLPLLGAMSIAEIEAVVAHELGHFVGCHGRSAGFVYRVRLRWAQTAERLPTGIVAGAMQKFFGWYGPWFASYSFVLARQQEYEADRVAARVVGARVAADALIRVNIQAERIGQAWSAIWSQATTRDDPPSSPYRTVAAVLVGEQADDDGAMQRALMSGVALDDTHPTLSQRLAALQEEPRLPPLLLEPASSSLLGGAADRFWAHFDAQWHDRADAVWAEDYEQRQNERAEQRRLGEEIASGDRAREKLFRHAWLTELIDGPASGTAAYAAMREHYPDAPDARFRQGDCLLECGDERGIALLLEVADAEFAFRSHAYRRIVSFLIASGRGEEADVYCPLLEAAEKDDARASAEANSIDESVALRPIDPATGEKLIALARDVFGVKSLHASVRDLKYPPQHQIVFVFEAKKGAVGQEVLDALIEALLPAGDLLGIEKCRKRRWLAKRIEALPNSRIL